MAGAAQDTGRLMSPTLKMPYHKWEGLLFTLGLLHNFTLVKVEEVATPHRVDIFIFRKILFSFLNVKIKIDIIVAANKLTVSASTV